MQVLHLDWQTRGCSIFGRSLIYNSCLAARLWFPATQAYMTSLYENKFQVRLNQFFRQGRKRANISYDTRCLPKHMGGLAQLDTHRQIDLLRAKWITKSLANPPPFMVYILARQHRQTPKTPQATVPSPLCGCELVQP